MMFNNDTTTFLSSQLSSFKTFLSTSPYVKGLTSNEINKEIALHNTKMLKVVSDFNNSKLLGEELTPVLPGFAGWGEWDDSDGVFTGGESRRGNNPFVHQGERYAQEGGRNSFASHHPGIFNRGKTKTKEYVRAGASTLFKSGGRGSGAGGVERRLFGYGNLFHGDSSEGSVDEEDTSSKSRRGGKRVNGRNEKGKENEEKENWEGDREVLLLDSSENEGEVDGIASIVAKGGLGGAKSVISKSDMEGREGDAEAEVVVINKANSAHQKRMNWIMEITGRKRKVGSEKGEEYVEMGMKRGRGRPGKNLEMERGGDDMGKIKRGRGRPRNIEILE